MNNDLTLEQKKAQARAAFIKAREEYLRDQTDGSWRAFCDAKRVCRLLGVLV